MDGADYKRIPLSIADSLTEFSKQSFVKKLYRRAINFII
jgi:hypothetical protein